MSRKMTGLALLGAAGVIVARRRSSRPPVATDPGETGPVATASVAPLAGRSRTVLAEDGVELAVTEYGSEDGPDALTATVLLSHGYVQSSALWNGQVRDLIAARPDLRVVTYDHRGHGASGRTSRAGATLEQLGRDLERVLDAVAPTGPVIVGGHSMGGMTIMALAEQAPELFGDRIVGVALVATSAGHLSEVTWGLPAPVARVIKAALPKLNEKAVRDELRGKPRTVTAAEARLIFPRRADPALVREALDVQRATRAETVAYFFSAFGTHDRLEVLKALTDVPTVAIVGDRDRLCPVEHSQALAGALRASQLIVYPGVGHMVQMERRTEVSRALLALVDRSIG